VGTAEAMEATADLAVDTAELVAATAEGIH